MDKALTFCQLTDILSGHDAEGPFVKTVLMRGRIK